MKIKVGWIWSYQHQLSNIAAIGYEAEQAEVSTVLLLK